MPAVAISAAGIVATICVAVTDVGVIAGFVPKFTLAPLANPPPFKVRVKAGPPEVALVGDIDESVRVAPVTEKFTAPEVPPPGAGFVTVTGKVPTVAISAARIAAVTCVELTNMVVLATPLNFTAEPFTKLLPLTVSVNAAPLATALVGEIVVIAGTGLVTLKLCGPVVPPPGAGFVTVTFSGPAVKSCAPGIVTVSVLPPLDTTPPESALLPKFTTDPDIKFVPVSVKGTL